mgnify:CR=1 FL=1
MHLIVTRSFPPEMGGMQNLMWGLANSISKYNLIKVFADYQENHKEVDDSVSFSIERIGGTKLIRKYRKAYLVNEFINKNKKIECIIADHWKSLELIKSNKKKVCLIHSKEINHDKGSRSNKRVLNVLNNVDHIVANSEFTKNLAIENGVKSDKIIVINPGVYPVKSIDNKILDEAEKLLKDKLDTIYFDDQINMPEPTSDQLKEVNAYADAHRNEDTRYRINWDIIMSRIFLNHEFEIFELVLAHEIGHVLGLTHCCDFPENKCDEKFICNEIMSVGFKFSFYFISNCVSSNRGKLLKWMIS